MTRELSGPQNDPASYPAHAVFHATYARGQHPRVRRAALLSRDGSAASEDSNLRRRPAPAYDRIHGGAFTEHLRKADYDRTAHRGACGLGKELQ